MTSKTFMMASLMTILGATVGKADMVQTLTVRGEVIDKSLASISFESDVAVLTFTDGSVQTVPVDQVALTVAYGKGESGIKATTKSDSSTPSAVYTLEGRYAGTDLQALPSGVYIKDGKKITVRRNRQ